MTTHLALLHQIDGIAERLGMSQAQVRQLAFETLAGVAFPVRVLSDLSVAKLVRLLAIMAELERNQPEREAAKR